LHKELRAKCQALYSKALKVPQEYEPTPKEVSGSRQRGDKYLLQFGIYGGLITIGPLDTKLQCAYLKHLLLNSDIYKEYLTFKAEKYANGRQKKLKEPAKPVGKSAEYIFQLEKQIELQRGLLKQVTDELLELRGELLATKHDYVTKEELRQALSAKDLEIDSKAKFLNLKIQELSNITVHQAI
jgi:hypothetical protein